MQSTNTIIVQIHHYNKVVHEFYQEEQVYWAPASTTSALYSQLASRKYREIPKEQLKSVISTQDFIIIIVGHPGYSCI